MASLRRCRQVEEVRLSRGPAESRTGRPARRRPSPPFCPRKTRRSSSLSPSIRYCRSMTASMPCRRPSLTCRDRPCIVATNAMAFPVCPRSKVVSRRSRSSRPNRSASSALALQRCRRWKAIRIRASASLHLHVCACSTRRLRSPCRRHVLQSTRVSPHRSRLADLDSGNRMQQP
jgi:hypothetical protein